jgi:sugar phosphate isomerase/epimerase
MKLSVELCTLSERFGDLKAIEIAKKVGFDAIDYSYYIHTQNAEILGDSYREYAQRLRSKLDECGICCNQAHAPFKIRYENKFDVSDQEYLWLVRSIESAAILGAETIVVHVLDVPKGVDFEDFNVRYYQGLIPYCEKFGIRVAVENLFHHDRKRKCIVGNVGTPAELNRMVAKIDSPWVVACVDIGHASVTGFEPEEFIEGMNPNILKCLHVQDTDYLEDRHILPYTGSLNWANIMQSLKAIGYTGDLTFEILNYLKKFPNELVEDSLKLAVSVGRYLISLCEN